MKKFTSLLLILALALGLLAGCGTQTEDTTDYSTMTIEELKPLIQTVVQGKLTMVTSPDYAPYEFYALGEDGTPTLAGFDIALGQYIADFLGLELEVIPMDFDGTITELSARKADIGMAGYNPDPKREVAMLFSDIYYTSSQSFICHQDMADTFTTLADTNSAAYQIGAQMGSIQVNLARTNSPDADIVELPKATDIVAEVLSHKLDGAYVETVVAQAYAKNYPELVVKFDVPYEADGNVVGVNKGNAPLLVAVNLAIKAAIADGSLQTFIEEANMLAQKDTYQGLLDGNGDIPPSAE